MNLNWARLRERANALSADKDNHAFISPSFYNRLQKYQKN